MNAVILKERFLDLLTPPLPNDWEAEENLENLVPLPETRQNTILQHVNSIWPVSNSLCYSYLACADSALKCLNDQQVGNWVADILDIYEKKGLKDAQLFMMDVEGKFLCRIRGENGVRFEDVVAKLLPYAKGIAKKKISLEVGSNLYTDTSTVFLPEKITTFQTVADNFLLYKLMITAELCLIRCKTYDLEFDPSSPLILGLYERYSKNIGSDTLLLDDFWNVFPEPRLAEDIFTLVESYKIRQMMASDFPGLSGDTNGLMKELAKRRIPIDTSPKYMLLENLSVYILSGGIYREDHFEGDTFRSILAVLDKTTDSASDSAEKTAKIYTFLNDFSMPYASAIATLPYIGKLVPAAARQVRMNERAEVRQRFIEAFSAIVSEIQHLQADENKDIGKSEEPSPQITNDDISALLIPPGLDEEHEGSLQKEESLYNNQSIIISGPDIDIPESLKELATDIINDLGHIPDDYISAAQGFSGTGNLSQKNSPVSEGGILKGAITYNEWDYRRNGFRKDWCILNEKKVRPVKGSFVSKTLEKYKGLLIKLKKQFEMLRTAERFIKRQREGDDIDLDAVVESISDLKAGRPESEKLFIKLRRDDRDIGVMFLIDMSSSTEGWVGEALKESLILMGESLEILGDRYAIAGFSGMRRTRSEFFQVKDFDEPYNDEIRGRIAAISPQEYTRMGPPIRHATKMLQNLDAKVRLMIILSDGKPEDYDDYKGEYAIEDTRHALIEAKAIGIHPFCITIDKQAKDYNAHMYGDVNYIFLNKISDLPIRMPTIYRNLTT